MDEGVEVGLTTKKSGSGDGAVLAGAAKRLEKSQAHRAAFCLIEFGTHYSSFASHSGLLDTHPHASVTLHAPSVSASASWKK